MKLRKITAALILCAGIIITQTGCVREEPVSENQFLLDTVCTITVYDLEKSKAEDALDAAWDCCKKYESMLSKTVKGSDVYRINQAGGKAVAVQPETLEVIKKGIQYGELSQGMFDITIGAVSDLWDFTGEHPAVPEKGKLKQAVETVNYKQIQIDGNQVKMENPQARMDLGGIAKGYIADKVTEVMKARGVERAVISLGGNIAAIGDKKDGVPWKIGVERPYSDRKDILGAVEMENATIVTSGVYERCFEENGKLYHHVLNPKTGYPAETALDAVVIKGGLGRSVDCDALGTVCLMLGEDKSREILSDLKGIQAAFIDRSDRITVTDGFEIQDIVK